MMRDGNVPNGAKRDRQRAILELIARNPIGSQDELAERLGGLGFAVTQATVSRDVAELGLVKIGREDRHVYVSPADLPGPVAAGQPDAGRGDRHLRRLLEDIPVTVARSGLTLVVLARPGMANAIAQAIDESSLGEQVGTLAGDDTLLVLFADEAHLQRWLERFQAFEADAPALGPTEALTPTDVFERPSTSPPSGPSPTPPVTSEAPR